MKAYDVKSLTVIVTDMKHDFDFCIACETLDDLLDIAERFPRTIYSFGEIEVNKSEKISLSE